MRLTTARARRSGLSRRPACGWRFFIGTSPTIRPPALSSMRAISFRSHRKSPTELATWLARMVPLESRLLETDGPWPYRGPFEGRATEPAMVLDAAGAVARALSLEREMVGAMTTANARKLFRIAT